MGENESKSVRVTGKFLKKYVKFSKINFITLQIKVQQLYKLDQALQEESGTLQNLQRDKEELERALYGLRSKLTNENTPIVVEAARRQQHALEMELSRVHQLLAENSKVEQV